MYKNYNKENKDLNALKIYLREINQFPLLTADEEKELSRRIEKGDEKAREKLISSNLRFVVKIARGYQGQGLPLEDLISEGNKGVINAAERFDYRKKVRFSTYSNWWIKSALQKAVLKSPTIYIPKRKLQAVKYIIHLQEKGNSINEIAKITGKDSEEIEYLLNLPDYVVSLNSLLSDSEEFSPTYEDIIPDSRSSPETKFNPEKRILLSAIDKYLSSKEADVVKSYFGLVDGHHTLDEMSRKYNVTRERIRQIKDRGVKILKEHAEESQLEICLQNTFSNN